MKPADARRAVAAGAATAEALGLVVEDAVVLHDSNKLTVRLLPGDVVARVAPAHEEARQEATRVARLEVDLALALTASGSPVATLDPRVEPRVHERDGFVVTLWTYYEPVSSAEGSPADYAHSLQRLHAGLRTLDLPVPHYTDRVKQAQRLVAGRELTPGLADPDRELLDHTLRRLRRVIGERGGAEQLQHGEPHPGNLLNTSDGRLFIDFETCCRGAVELDLAHAPYDVGEHYPGVDAALVRDCRLLVLAMVTTWRWDRDDEFPDGRRLGTDGLARIRASVSR